MSLPSQTLCDMNRSPTNYIDNDEALEGFLTYLDGHDWFALDTEFEREKTYYPRLCLLQIATPERVAWVYQPGEVRSSHLMSGDPLTFPQSMKRRTANGARRSRYRGWKSSPR